MKDTEFWIATVSDGDGLHWSEILWGDGYTEQEAIAEAWRSLPGLYLFPGQELQLHGPYICNVAAVTKYGERQS